MKIGFFEDVPVLEDKLKKVLASQKGLLLEAVKSGERYDIVLCDKNYFPDKASFESRIYLVPGSARILALPEEGILLTGGMNREDAVSFSSIGETSALLCLGKEIFLHKKNIFPFEMKVPFDRSFSLYKNLAVGFALSLITLIFTEEL